MSTTTTGTGESPADLLTRPNSNRKPTGVRKGPKSSAPKLAYQLKSFAKQADNQAIYGVAFSPHLQMRGRYIFAAAHGDRVTTYECIADGSLKMLQCYADDDPDECFHSVVSKHDVK